MKYFFITLGFLLTISLNAAADDSEPPTGTVALLCKMSRHAQVVTQTLSVDYDRKLVNDVQATFTPSTIIWTVEMGGGINERHELNRITGTYTYWLDNAAPTDPIPTFNCEKAPLKF